MRRSNFITKLSLARGNYHGLLAVIFLVIQLAFVPLSLAKNIALDKSIPLNKKYLEPNKADIILGDVDAKNTVIEYFSLTCLHCALFYEKLFPQIKKEFIDTGKIRWIKRPFVTDQRALNAGLLLECKKQNTEDYTKFLSILLSKQEVWATGKNYMDILKNIAKLSGMTSEKIDACLVNNELAKQITEESVAASRNLGIKATPSFFLNADFIANGLTAEVLNDLLSKSVLKNE